MHRQPLVGVNQHQLQPRGRGVTVRLPVSGECICDRSKRVLLCSACGYRMKGRVRTTCNRHPMTIYLMDIETCPGCRAHSFMIKEYPLEEDEE